MKNFTFNYKKASLQISKHLGQLFADTLFLNI